MLMNTQCGGFFCFLKSNLLIFWAKLFYVIDDAVAPVESIRELIVGDETGRILESMDIALLAGLRRRRLSSLLL